MSDVLESLIVELALDSKDYASGLKKADNETTSWAAKLGGAVSDLVGGVAMAGIGAAVTAVGAIGVAAFDVSSQVHAAAGDMAASLGIPTEEAEHFANVARDVYGNNFAADVTEAAGAVTEVAKQMNLAAEDPALKTMTENAFRLKDAFGTDVNESVSAAKTLMENFGVSGDEAFDMIARGYQVGLDRSGDFLDTIGEYSVQFAEGGATASEFFSTLDTGLQGGMLGTDKAADLFKEFRVRIQDGSDLTADSLAAIGLDAGEMAAKFADGSLTAVDAFNMVSSALRQTSDENVQFQAGVGLLGTQFEDLGASAALGIDTMSDNFFDIGDSVENLDAQYNTFGDVATGIWRRIVVSVSPLTDVLLSLANSLMPSVLAVFDALDQVLQPIIAGFTEWAAGITSFSDLFTIFEDGSGKLMDLLVVFGMTEDAAQGLMAGVYAIRDTFDVMFGPLVDLIANFVSWKDVLIGVGLAVAAVVVPAIISMVVAAAPVIAIALALIGAIALLRHAWESDFLGIRTYVEKFFGWVSDNWIDWIYDLQKAWTEFSAWWTEDVPKIVDSVKQFFQGFIDFLTGAWQGLVGSLQSGWEGFSSWWQSDTQTKLASIQSGWNSFYGWLDDQTGGSLSTVQGYWQSWSDQSLAINEQFWGGVGQLAGTGIEATKGVVSAGVLFMQGDWEGGLEALRSTAETAWAAIYEQFQTQIDAVTGIFSGVDWAGVGMAILQGIGQGFNDGWDWLKGKAEEVAQGALDAAKWVLGIGSPSRVAAAEIGEPFMEGIGVGAMDAVHAAGERIQSTMQQLLGDVAPPALNGANYGASPITITIYLQAGATYEDGRAVGAGVADELRARGLG